MGKTSHWIRHTNRKGLECSIQIQHLELLNKREEWNESLQHCTIELELCWKVERLHCCLEINFWQNQLKLQRVTNNLVPQQEVMCPYHKSLRKEKRVLWIQFKDLVKNVLLPTMLLIWRRCRIKETIAFDWISWQSCFQII